jgi:hypothetical protein
VRSNPPTALAVAVASACLAYSLGFSGYSARWMRRLLSRTGREETSIDVWSWMLARLLGGTLMTCLSLWSASFLGYSPSGCGLNFNHFGVSLLIVVATWAGLVPLLSIIARVWPGLFRGYPQMRSCRLSKQNFVLNASSWIIYFVGFEILYRGLLIFPLAAVYGRWTAVAVSSGIYVVGEIAQQPVQLVQIGLMPVAVGLGALAVLTGSILGPLLIHSFTASAFDFYAVPAEARRGCQLLTSP